MHNPFETKGGGAMASHAYLRAFCELNNGNIDVVVADHCQKSYANLKQNYFKFENIYYVHNRSLLRRLLSVFNGHLNRYIGFVRKIIIENHNRYNLIVFDHSSIAGPLAKLAKSYGLKTITIHHNYEKEYYHDNHSKLDRMLFLRHVVNCEKDAFLFSDLNLFLTEQDERKFHEVYGKPSGHSSIIGVFEFGDSKVAEIKESTNKKRILQLVITGSLCTVQGVDGIKYFFEDLYPLIPTFVQIVVAGRKPTNEVISLCESHNNVTLVPNPENMEDIIRNGDIYICPTRVGGGLKLRVMDGLKLGIPVIAHQCSSRGYDMFHDSLYFKVFSNPLEFKNSLNEMIYMYSNKCVSKKKVQEEYLASFSYHSGLGRLSRILKSTL